MCNEQHCLLTGRSIDSPLESIRCGRCSGVFHLDALYELATPATAATAATATAATAGAGTVIATHIDACAVAVTAGLGLLLVLLLLLL